MKKSFLILLIIILYGCQDDLTGHWHMKRYNDEFISFDIEKNNNAYMLLSLNDNIKEGKLFPESNDLFFPGECGYLAFNYEFKNDKLYLESYLGEKVIAERIKDTCDRFQDFHTLLNIDYLVVKNRRDDFQPKDSTVNTLVKEYINIDYSTNGDSIQLEYFDRVSSLQHLDSIIEYIGYNYSDAEIPFIHYILTPDKHITISDLNKVIDQLPKNNPLYIRTLKPKMDNWKAFEYIPVDAIDLNSDLQLQEIIN